MLGGLRCSIAVMESMGWTVYGCTLNILNSTNVRDVNVTRKPSLSAYRNFPFLHTSL